MRNRKINYAVTHKFKTSKSNLTEEEMKDIFNKKLSKYIMTREKNLYDVNTKKEETKK